MDRHNLSSDSDSDSTPVPSTNYRTSRRRRTLVAQNIIESTQRLLRITSDEEDRTPIVDTGSRSAVENVNRSRSFGRGAAGGYSSGNMMSDAYRGRGYGARIHSPSPFRSSRGRFPLEEYNTGAIRRGDLSVGRGHGAVAGRDLGMHHSGRSFSRGVRGNYLVTSPSPPQSHSRAYARHGGYRPCYLNRRYQSNVTDYTTGFQRFNFVMSKFTLLSLGGPVARGGQYGYTPRGTINFSNQVRPQFTAGDMAGSSARNVSSDVPTPHPNVQDPHRPEDVPHSTDGVLSTDVQTPSHLRDQAMSYDDEDSSSSEELALLFAEAQEPLFSEDSSSPEDQGPICLVREDLSSSDSD